MTDLRTLAVKAEEADKTWPHLREAKHLRATDAFHRAASPTAILALYAEIDGLRAERDELLAERIYNGWRDQDGWVPWVPRGNSDKQADARREARAITKEPNRE